MQHWAEALTVEATKAAEAVARRCSVQNVFLKLSQNLQENTCAGVSFLIKLQDSNMQLY